MIIWKKTAKIYLSRKKNQVKHKVRCSRKEKAKSKFLFIAYGLDSHKHIHVNTSPDSNRACVLLLQQKKYMSKQICILIGKFFKVHSLSKEQNTLHKQRHSNCNCLLLSFEKQKCVSIYAFYLHRTASLSNQKKNELWWWGRKKRKRRGAFQVEEAKANENIFRERER